MSKGFYLTLVAALLWAASILVLKIILQTGIGIYSVLLWQTIIEAPFWLVTVAQKRNEIPKLQLQDFKILATIALFSSFGVTIVEFFAIRYSPAVNYAFLIRTVILFTFLFAYVFLGEKISFKKICLSILILVGAYFLVSNGTVIALTKGDIFTLFEAALIAFGNNVIGKRAAMRMHPTIGAGLSELIGIVPRLLIVFYFGASVLVPASIGWIILLAVLYFALTQVRFRVLKIVSASYMTMIMSFTPVFVSIVAIPLFGEFLSPIQIIGGLLIISAGILVEKLKV